MSAEKHFTTSHRLFCTIVQKPRVWWFRLLSSCHVSGRPVIIQPTQIIGKGHVVFHGRVIMGCYPSPFFFIGYSYLEARYDHAIIEIGDGTWINNNFVAISAHKGISIGKKVMIGSNVEVYDSDFHNLDPEKRHLCEADEDRAVVIEENVFIGSNVKILKGVCIGRDSVIANGSIVVKDIPAGVIAGGNPAKVIRAL